jgi:hypothetical protein
MISHRPYLLVSGKPPIKKAPEETGALKWLIKLFFKLRGLGYVGCLQALGALDDLERNLVAFVQRLEAVSRDGRKVHEHVLAIVLRDKTKPLAVIEPLHYTVCHSCFSSASFFEFYPGIIHGLLKNTAFYLPCQADNKDFLKVRSSSFPAKAPLKLLFCRKHHPVKGAACFHPDPEHGQERNLLPVI